MKYQEVEKELMQKYEQGNDEFRKQMVSRLITTAGFESLVQINNDLHMCSDCARKEK